ncbi:MAG: dTDP-4-dehydrorhamnose 3,5-epimerase family protein [Actinobacteria bacterium]|nr:dTDP-4-dehydrorhamnose 3,5-epimerase family protein [Actinomycetota bacterium]
MNDPAQLPDGVTIRELKPNRDDRGVFTELHRDEWGAPARFVQWNAVRSCAGVLRGVHLHHRHHDYLTMALGRMFLGLADLRPESPTYRLACCLELSAERPRGASIPPGVAHGFLFPEESIHVYAVSHYWDLADELGCRWDDPDMGIPWPHEPSLISDRDRDLPALSVLTEQFLAARSE